LAIALVAVVLSAPAPPEDRARAIGSQIRCPVCQGEAIIDSPSETARAMMEQVRARIAEGRTDDEIINELLSAYGGSLLLDPPARGATLWLWLAPVVALAAGGAMIAGRFRAPTAEGAEPRAAPALVKRRWVWGAAFLVTAGAVTVATVGQFQQARPDDQTLSGVAGGQFDPDAVSNETLEAVIGANADNPQINGMRLALANRYFEAGSYQQAFGHYQIVLENEPTTTEAANSFTRLGWMVFDGNGEVDLGLELIDRGLALVPDDAFALYLKGQILWCGKDDPQAAAALFESILASPDLDPQVSDRVREDLDALANGTACQ
jgi:cytochrome c-type biogenesis protein CcmH